MIFFLSRTSWRYMLFNFNFTESLLNAFLKAQMLVYVVFRWWREPEEYHQPATSLYPYSKRGRRVDKRVFYHCAVIKHIEGENSTKIDTKTSNTVNQIRSTALERSVIKYLGLTQLDGILTSPSTSEVVQNSLLVIQYA